MEQYVNRIEEFLEASMSREALPDPAGPCRHCHQSIAVWRCRDCVLPCLLCRSCMRSSHQENPFHRIEYWNGSYFRRADLSEVGAYLLIRHHTGVPLCETLTKWTKFLDAAQKDNDRKEQDELSRFIRSTVPVPVPVGMWEPEKDYEMDEFDEDEGEDLGDGDEELIEKEDEDANPALAEATLGTLRRVVHTNGIHHIGMVYCECHGKGVLPLDLFALQLLPASLIRIRTIFTAQVLDQYRLCNLELKASAYQFYQLLRRLTTPMAPDEVIDLYREFRRMTRIWRWMKRLKWAGYAGSSKKVKDVEAGELTIFCPACPQQGINIPDDWRDDSARQVNNCYNFYISTENLLDGCTNVYLLETEILKQTMSDKSTK